VVARMPEEADLEVLERSTGVSHLSAANLSEPFLWSSVTERRHP
jgi:hypothetical protein